MLFEDGSMNRMKEALSLFDEICNSNWFLNTSMILFLNKRDLFADKIMKVDINSVEHFNDFSGAAKSFGEGSKYFEDKFLGLNQSPDKKQVYSHITCATDTDNVDV